MFTVRVLLISVQHSILRYLIPSDVGRSEQVGDVEYVQVTGTFDKAIISLVILPFFSFITISLLIIWKLSMPVGRFTIIVSSEPLPSAYALSAAFAMVTTVSLALFILILSEDSCIE